MINGAWIIIAPILIIGSFINPLWGAISLAGLFLYALIGAESQVWRSLSNYKNIPRFVPFLLSLLPVVIFYSFPQSHIVTPQIFYIISSILAFFASYSTQIYGGKSVVYEKAPPIWIGLFSLAWSGLLYYLGFYKIAGGPTVALISFTLLFYVSGALVIYINIDEQLQHKYVKHNSI